MNFTPAALDTGFGFTKASTLSAHITIPSIAGEPIEMLDGIIKEQSEGIIAQVNDKKLFVGPLAVRQSPVRYFSLNENKPDDSITKFVGLTALSMALPDDPDPVRLVTALPVNHYFGMRADAERSLVGDHEVIVNGQCKDFRIEQCRTTVQGLEALFDSILDDCGSVVAQWAMQPVAVVDIGFYTTNLIVVNRLEPVRKLCKSIPLGISSAWKLLIDFLYKEKRIELNLYEMDDIVKLQTIEARGQQWDISSAITSSLNAVAAEINGQIETLWPQRPYAKILGAGGGMLRMASKILPGELIPVQDPQRANVRGGLKLARRDNTWQQKSLG